MNLNLLIVKYPNWEMYPILANLSLFRDLLQFQVH
jgi:hypothetical protein